MNKTLCCVSETHLLAIIFVVQVRLVDGPNPYTGRVEVYISTGGLGSWGTICDDNWDIQDAKVVCHELGYPYAVGAPTSAHHGEGTGAVLLDNVQCLGNETGIIACMHNGIGNHDCFHHEDASVECLCTYVDIVLYCIPIELITNKLRIELFNIRQLQFA